jgi:hypothetical protein
VYLYIYICIYFIAKKHHPDEQKKSHKNKEVIRIEYDTAEGVINADEMRMIIEQVSENICMYICVYIYIYIYVYINADEMRMIIEQVIEYLYICINTYVYEIYIYIYVCIY